MRRATVALLLVSAAAVTCTGCSVEAGVRLLQWARQNRPLSTEMTTMEMRVGPMTADTSGNVAVLLHNSEKTWVLPIWIGTTEAQAILSARDGKVPTRPMTHDLCAVIIEKMQAKVEKITITRLENATFYAVLDLVRDGRRIRVDARPSDSIVLALKAKRPIYVALRVVEEAGIHSQDRGELPEGPLAKKKIGV